MNKILPPEPTLTVFPYHAWFEYDGTIYYPAGVTYRGVKLPPIVKGEAAAVFNDQMIELLVRAPFKPFTIRLNGHDRTTWLRWRMNSSAPAKGI